VPGQRKKERFRELFAEVPAGVDQFWFEQPPRQTAADVDRREADLAAVLLRPMADALRGVRRARSQKRGAGWASFLSDRERSAGQMRGAAALVEGRVDSLSGTALADLLAVTRFKALTVPAMPTPAQVAAEIERARAELQRLDRYASRVRETVETHIEELDQLLADRTGRDG
jgi:hypothetical protein